MNDEIREIERVIIDVKRKLKFSPERRFVELFDKEDIKQLLEYITNLQQENKRLQQNNYDMQREMAMCWQRIKKAVDYIKKHIQKYDIDSSMGDFDEFDMLTKPNYLLNILQNGSDEE